MDEEKTSESQSPNHSQDEIKLMLGVAMPRSLKELQENKIEKQTRCKQCVGIKKDIKTKILCYQCETPVCLEHKISLC